MRYQLTLFTSQIMMGILFLIMTSGDAFAGADVPIRLWYGENQQFGTLGHTQRWINVLGHVDRADQIQLLQFAVNGGTLRPLSFREDRKRIATDGDFNIEIDRTKLRAGENQLRIVATDLQGHKTVKTTTIRYQQRAKPWPLPYSINWSTVSNVQDVAQIVDGKWALTAKGIRAVEPYYDRTITLGDGSWKNYEVTTTITVHRVTGPRELPNTTGVTHAAIALRWPGHDQDGKQPSVKWFPLGATGEFRLGSDLKHCRWRVFDGKRKTYVESKRRRAIEFEKPYAMKHRVETLPNGRSWYRVKLWPAREDEPSRWDLERFESDDLQSGSVCLIAHHSDVTFGNVAVVPVRQHPSYIYDPVKQTSFASKSPLDFFAESESHLQHEISTTLSAAQSFTVEAFAKPDATLKTRPKDFLPVFAATGGGGGDSLRAGIWRSKPPHSYHWWHASCTQGKSERAELARNRYRGISMVTESTPWRHLALTWEFDSRTLSFYVDYQLQASKRLEAIPDWDLSKIAIGRSREGESFQGRIVNPRASAKSLPPWKFLRQTEVPLQGVRFAAEQHPALPVNYGHADVRLHYGAVGDGVHDDTAAIRKAFAECQNRVPNEYRTIYFPAGTYLISDTIQFNRFMVVRGSGKGTTTIRLMDNANGFATPEIPKPAFAVGYEWPYVNRSKKQRAGNVIGNYIFDLTIDIGKGNSSALGLDFHCNNVGCVENVDIRSADGSGMVGLDFRRAWPGPCLIKNVSITGFDIGIAAAHREYSLVFSGIHLKNQNEAAIDNGGNVLSLENVFSENNVPAVRNRGGGLVTLINSRLIGGTSEVTAIESHNASLYVRNLTIEGYGNSVHETQQAKDAPLETLVTLPPHQIDEHFTGPSHHAFETEEKGSLKLDIKQTPVIPHPPVDQWVNVVDYKHRVNDGDWAPAIQAAINTNKPLVYFPDGERYQILSDVTIRGAVQTFFGGSPKTSITNGDRENPANGPAFILGRDVDEFQFDMLTTSHVVHKSPTTLVFRHCQAGHITADERCGDLFIEDAGGKWRFSKHQKVWGRQLNPETKGTPEIVNAGAQLWVLGLKTEYLSTKIENRDGARTEILGGLMYPVHSVTDESLPMFLNEDSDISLVHGVSVYKKNHKIYMREIRSGNTTDFSEWNWISGRPISNLYRSSRK